jgi:hypothetical protein
MSMPYTQELSAAIRHYVVPDRRYLKLLHGNVLGLAEPERTGFLRILGRDAYAVDEADLAVMLSTSSGWRERLTAAWMAGIASRTVFRERLGELLLASTQCYAGQGYCFALACFATTDDAELLRAYLDKYLRRPDLAYDQDWAMSALLHIDATLGTRFAAPYLTPDGLWFQWSKAEDPRASVDRGSERFAALASLRSRLPAAAPTSAETPIVDGPILSGWSAVATGQAAGLDAELPRGLGERHILSGVPTTATARCESCDTVLYRLDEDPAQWAIVHLTWLSKDGPGSFPMWEIFATTQSALAGMRSHSH